MSPSYNSIHVHKDWFGDEIIDFGPHPPSRILPPSQLARNYRDQTSRIEIRAEYWNKAGIETRSKSIVTKRGINVPKPNSLFWKRFMELPGEVRNQIYDELLQTNPDLHPVSLGIHLGKSYHAEAVYAGIHHIPLPVLCQQQFGPDFINELVDRWCLTVTFHLVESFELDIKRPWPEFRGLVFKCSSLHLRRYLDPAPDSPITQLRATTWFPRMRKCYLKLNLFRLRSSMKYGKFGRENFRSCLSEVASVLKGATTLTELRIDVVLWPQKMPSAKERERPKFINTDDLNYRWDTLEKDDFAGHLQTCLDALKEIPGIKTIRVYGLNLIDAWWNVDDPDNFQSRKPSHLSTPSSQRHFIPAM